MYHIWDRVGTQLIARVSGPMKFRLVLQPCMAAFFAIRSGLADAKTGKSPYFWTMVSDPNERAELLKDGWKSVGKVFMWEKRSLSRSFSPSCPTWFFEESLRALLDE